MKESPPRDDHDACGLRCASGSPLVSAAVMNRECFCPAVDRRLVHAELEAVLHAHGVPESLAETHPHLFSALPLYVSRRDIAQAARVVAAIEQVVARAAYRAAAMAWAPDIARFEPGSPGGLLGLDFHLDAYGPRLIEINTNPGGVLLNAVLLRAYLSCMPALLTAPVDPRQLEQAVVDALLHEWRLQRGAAPLGMIVIVDETPERQYLYPEFLLFRGLLQRHGYQAEICSPHALRREHDGLWLGERRVDLVYNRLTDFSLQQPAHADIRAAYLAGEVAVSPHPRAHALYADKRNLSLLGDREFLVAAGVDSDTVQTLVTAVPVTALLTSENRDAMWASRPQWFFKPAAGFGSKASYRGDKLTRRVWDEIAGGTYVAQQIVAPSERHVGSGGDPMKVDIRCYAYRGIVLLVAARMYRGQTTNFRTPGGGFAPVLTGPDIHVET